jgi:CRAL/TRIO domain
MCVLNDSVLSIDCERNFLKKRPSCARARDDSIEMEGVHPRLRSISSHYEQQSIEHTTNQETSIIMEAFLRSGVLLLGDIPIDHHVVMLLTTQEITKARLIKAAVEWEASLKNLSDFEYVQYALTHGASTENNQIPTILEHISRMQAFKETYGIQDTVADGLACIQAAMEQHPGLFLSIHYNAEDGNTTAVEDWAAFFPGTIATPEQHACLLKGLYYRFECLNPTFLATRLGVSNLIECQGVSWQNHDTNLQEQLLAELLVSYPTRYREMYLVNSPLVVNLAIALWKRHMSRNLRETFRLGYQLPGMEGRRIDVLFKIPTPEIADRATISTSRDLLVARYQHRATYQLPAL